MWEVLNRLLGRGEEPASRTETLASMGTYIVSDEKLKERLKMLEEFYQVKERIVALKEQVNYTDPVECLGNLIVYMNSLNRLLDSVATPYFRALNSREASIAMHAWSELNGYFFDMAYTLRNWFLQLKKAKEGRTFSPDEGEDEARRIVFQPRLPESVSTSNFLSFIIREYLPRAEALVRTSWSSSDVTPAWIGAIQPQMVNPAMLPPIRTFDTGSFGGEEERERKPTRRFLE